MAIVAKPRESSRSPSLISLQGRKRIVARLRRLAEDHRRHPDIAVRLTAVADTIEASVPPNER